MGQLFIQSNMDLFISRYVYIDILFSILFLFFFLFVSFILLYFSLQCYMLPQVLVFQITTMKLAQNTALLL